VYGRVRGLSVLCLAGALMTGGAGEAQAFFGDRCFRDLQVNGRVQGTMADARGAAIAAWEKQAAKRHGARFANWYYSADRSIDCFWNEAGNKIRCRAIATPCGRAN
jgi:hypothetical protein